MSHGHAKSPYRHNVTICLTLACTIPLPVTPSGDDDEASEAIARPRDSVSECSALQVQAMHEPHRQMIITWKVGCDTFPVHALLL